MADNNKTSQKSLALKDKMKEIFFRKRRAPPTEENQESETSNKQARLKEKLEIDETSNESAKMEVDQATEEPPAAAFDNVADFGSDSASAAYFDDDVISSDEDSSASDIDYDYTGPRIAPRKLLNYYPADKFLEEIGASTVLASFGEALQTGNMKEFGRQLEREDFPVILVMLSVTHYIDNDPASLLKFLKNYVMGSKCDIDGFTRAHGLRGTHQLTLLHALFNVMTIYQQASDVDEPADLVAEAIVTACEAWIWDERVFFILSELLESPDDDTVTVGLVVITAVANLCKGRTSKLPSRLIHKARILDAVHAMAWLDLTDDLIKRVTLCAQALRGMLYP